MFKCVRRYVRDRFEKKIVNKKEKVDGASVRKPACDCIYHHSLVPEYLQKVNYNFHYQLLAVRPVKEQKNEKRKDPYKTSTCLDNSWIEAIGLSGTLAFGWALSENLDIRRRRSLRELVNFHQNPCNYEWKRALCPYFVFRNALPKHVLAQPNEILNPNLLVKPSKTGETKIALPYFGPQTAEEALNEVSEGLRKARNLAVGELENRLGLQCMSKQRYRKAIIHFAAGSALQNDSAAYNLAQCYELGLGTGKDLSKAAKCYLKASELGNPTATYNLAVFYAQGLGGLKCDCKKARQLLEKADSLGDPNAKSVLENWMKKKRNSSTVNNQPKPPKITVDSGVKGSQMVNSVMNPILSNLQLPFIKLNLDEVTKVNSVTASRTNVLFSDFGDGKLNYLGKDVNKVVPVENLSHTVKTYPSFPANESGRNFFPLSYDVPSDKKKDFDYPIPFLMKLYKIAAVPGGP